MPRPDLHVNFSLAAGGEQVGLFAPDGTAIDQVTFFGQINDVSLGRYPDGAPTLAPAGTDSVMSSLTV